MSSKAKKRSQRQERHSARVERLRQRQSTRRRREGCEKRYEEAFREWVHAIQQGWACELVADYGYSFHPKWHTSFSVTGDSYYEVVVCDRCGLTQGYEDGGEDEDVYLCRGFEDIGCGSETCITVARYLEEAA